MYDELSWSRDECYNGVLSGTRAKFEWSIWKTSSEPSKLTEMNYWVFSNRTRWWWYPTPETGSYSDFLGGPQQKFISRIWDTGNRTLRISGHLQSAVIKHVRIVVPAAWFNKTTTAQVKLSRGGVNLNLLSEYFDTCSRHPSRDPSDVGPWRLIKPSFAYQWIQESDKWAIGKFHVNPAYIFYQGSKQMRTHRRNLKIFSRKEGTTASDCWISTA